MVLVVRFFRRTHSTKWKTGPCRHISWTERIGAKRKWLNSILSSLPKETLCKRRDAHVSPPKRVFSANLCQEVYDELADSWVIHAPFGQRPTSTANHTNTSSKTSSTAGPQTGSSSPYQEQSKRIHKHAIVIPYRDRSFHLKRFIDYMDYFLHYHYQQSDQQDPNTEQHEFSLFIMDQVDDELFNRALLMNAGLDHVSADTECVTIHDVDLVPAMFTKSRYHTCSNPLHLAGYSQSSGFSLVYPQFAGAIMTIHQQHWASINGMDNQFQGYGFEDDDLYHRLMFLGLLHCHDPEFPVRAVPYRPDPLTDHVVTTISQSTDHHTRGVRIHEAYRLNDRRARRFRRSGLSPSLTSLGGWNQSKYHVVHRESWSSSRLKFGGFAEIHHIQLHLDKASFTECFVNCDNRTNIPPATKNLATLFDTIC